LIGQVPELVAAAVASYQGTRFVSCLLKQLGESALMFDVCFYVENAPGRDLGRATDQVNREILRSFAQSGIAFATPARTVWLRDERAAQPSTPPSPEIKLAGEL
jgi:small-conductance mechanosensitive channel